MTLFTTDAIILNCIDYAESDKIVCAFTRDRGVIHAIAKGAKNSRKRFPGTLEPFCEVILEMSSRRDGDLARIESANLLSANLAIREDLELLAHASVLIELVKEHLGDLDPNPVTYDSLSRSLSVMEPDVQWFSIWCISTVNLLACLGYGIDLEGKRENAPKRMQELISEKLSKEAYMFLLKGSRLDGAILKKLTTGSHAKREITEFLLALCNTISEKKLKSAAFLAKLLDLNLIR
ncbi:MAG TPA: DNA repair protein RecO [Deltaproteobacteria bacterium]|nr:DNA repair protein RecO [Deltaproteobacteria bacterium]